MNPRYDDAISGLFGLSFLSDNGKNAEFCEILLKCRIFEKNLCKNTKIYFFCNNFVLALYILRTSSREKSIESIVV